MVFYFLMESDGNNYNDSEYEGEYKRTRFAVEYIHSKLVEWAESDPEQLNDEHIDLLNECLSLSEKLNLPNEYTDSEGGEHFSYNANEEVIEILKQKNKDNTLVDLDVIEIFREERCFGMDDLPDITFTIRFGFTGIVKTYLFRIYAIKDLEIYLTKYTQILDESNKEPSPFGVMLLNMTGESDLETATGINSIDEAEYVSLVDLIKSLKEST